MLKNILSTVLISSLISLTGLSVVSPALAKDSTFTIAAKHDKKAIKKTDNAKNDKKESTDKKTSNKKVKSVKTSALLNLNTASEAELKKLPGIGDKLAKNIIKYRTQNGNFKDISELKKVEGIGAKTIEKLKTLVSL